MKKNPIKISILLVLLNLCIILGDAFAAYEVNIISKTPPPCSFQWDASTGNIPSFDIKSKKKKKAKSRRNSGKVNYDSFRQYYEKAIKYFENRAFLSAARIFEELYPLAIGTPLGDTILFYFADSYFQNGDYQMAALQFREYTKRYPGSEKTELAYLNAIKSMYYNSPEYNLDQFVTTLAIEEVSMFIQQYPYSKYIDECNDILDALRDKLAKKEMEVVRMYYQMGHYEAAKIMAKNFLKTYSSPKFAPEVLAILVKNNFDFARKSVEQKKYFRYKDCFEAFEMLQQQYPESNFVVEVKKIANEANNQVKKIEEQKNKF